MNELFYWTGVLVWLAIGGFACWVLYDVLKLGVLAFDIVRWRAAILRENDELWRWSTPMYLARFFVHAWLLFIRRGVPEGFDDKKCRGTWRGYGKWVAHRSLS